MLCVFHFITSYHDDHHDDHHGGYHRRNDNVDSITYDSYDRADHQFTGGYEAGHDASTYIVDDDGEEEHTGYATYADYRRSAEPARRTGGSGMRDRNVDREVDRDDDEGSRRMSSHRGSEYVKDYGGYESSLHYRRAQPESTRRKEEAPTNRRKESSSKSQSSSSSKDDISRLLVPDATARHKESTSKNNNRFPDFGTFGAAGSFTFK